MSVHIPVLLNEILEYLDPQHGEHFIDCTLGGGGHTLAILERTLPDGKVLAIDADLGAIQRLKIPNNLEGERAPYGRGKLQILNIRKRLVLINDNFRNLKAIYVKRFRYPISGVLCDLGVSSDQLEVSQKGFSFQKDEPLDMRMRTKVKKARKQSIINSFTAADIVNRWSQQEIERILRQYGEEPYAQMIANRIVQSRKKHPITTTLQLVSIIVNSYSSRTSFKGARRRRSEGGRRRIHPATKTFQALRIAVNDELGSLKELLPQALAILKPHGRLAIISFHGAEDRVVKQFFHSQSRIGSCKVITRSPIRPSQQEVHSNRRSRSARLRVIERL